MHKARPLLTRHWPPLKHVSVSTQGTLKKIQKLIKNKFNNVKKNEKCTLSFAYKTI
jgi:hypothetical protein